MSKRWAIVGAGNGGHAFAAYLALQGLDIAVWDIVPETVEVLNRQGGVYIEGNGHLKGRPLRGFGKIAFASTDIGRVIGDAEVIWLILPSIYHKATAEKMAPYLRNGQIVILNPTAPLGPIEFEKALHDSGCTADVTLAASCTLLFAARLKEAGRVFINGQKVDVAAAAYPSSRNARVEAVTAPYFPEFRYVRDILAVSFDNMNFEFHPGPTLLYTAMIEKGMDFQYYLDFVPSQVKLIEAIDAERMALCRIYGYDDAVDAAEAFRTMYGYKGELLEMLTSADCYRGIMGPKSLQGLRYLEEDVPYALRAIQTLGKIARIETTAIDTVINLAYILRGEALAEGRTMANLGFDENTTVADVLRMCRG